MEVSAEAPQKLGWDLVGVKTVPEVSVWLLPWLLVCGWWACLR